MPSVGEITQRVRSGNNVMATGTGWRVVDQLPPNHEIFNHELPAIVDFVQKLEQLCDDYFRSQDKTRTTNYEDIAYVARQIEDGLTSEYENPALLPLNERLGTAYGDELVRIAGAGADYIDDIVRSLLGRPAGPFDHLAALADTVRDEQVDQLTIATLNHDVVLEHAFDVFDVQVSDGFDDPFGTLRVWNDHFSIPTRRLLKLHGSIDWWRYALTRDGWTGQFTARATDGDPEHARGPANELLDYPALGRPLILPAPSTRSSATRRASTPTSTFASTKLSAMLMLSSSSAMASATRRSTRGSWRGRNGLAIGGWLSYTPTPSVLARMRVVRSEASGAGGKTLAC